MSETDPPPPRPSTLNLEPQSVSPNETPAMPNVSSASFTAMMQIWQGQFPPPEAIERYDRVQPGAFDRIISMAEKSQQAQIESALQTQRFMHRDSARGQYLGAALAVFALAGALYCASINKPWIAAVCLSVPVMGTAQALITQRAPRENRSDEDRNEGNSES